MEAATAEPYPSNITVAGLPGGVFDMSVTIVGWTAPDPEDIYFELIAPTGNAFEFLGGVGGNHSVSSVNIKLDDSGGAQVPTTTLSSGTFIPTVLGSCVTLPSLASPNCAEVIGSSTIHTRFTRHLSARATDMHAVP